MPIAHVHLVSGSYPSGRLEEFQSALTALYGQTLSSPIDRIRVFVLDYPGTHVMVGGRQLTSVGTSGAAAPYFTMRVLAGRPPEQGRRLLAGVTDLLVEILGYERSLIRGELVELDPAHWSIGGRTAAEARQEEIRARQAGG